MSGNTISTIKENGTVTSGITLTSPGYADPVFTGGSISQMALQGSYEINAATPWTVVNYGTLDATGDGRTNAAGKKYGDGGIALTNGGVVRNTAGGGDTGVIEAQYAAVKITGAAGTVVNQGLISSSSYGVTLAAGGTVSNVAGATISGLNAIGLEGTLDIVQNAGSIKGGYDGSGIRVDNTGTYALIYNGFGASIYAGKHGYGVDVHGAGTVLNKGTIAVATLATGVELDGTGDVLNNSGVIYGYEAVQVDLPGAGGVVVSNAAAGTITSNGYGVDVSGSLTLTNQGTIAGKTGYGIQLAGNSGAASTLINAGYLGGAKDALKDTEGNLFFEIEQGSTIKGNVVAHASTAVSPLINVLDLTASAGTVALGTSFQNFNTIEIAPGTQWLLEGNQAAVASGQTFSGFTVNDTLDLTGVTFTAGESFSYSTVSASAGQLTITNAAGSYKIDFSGLGGKPQFQLASDGNGGTAITLENLAPANIVTGKVTEQVYLGNPYYGYPGNQLTVTNTGIVNTGTKVPAVITGPSYAVIATISNAGYITGYDGVQLSRAGTVTNLAGGTIKASVYYERYAIEVSGGAGIINNAGLISGYDAGIALTAGGTVVNAAGGHISGNGNAIYIGLPATSEVVNAAGGVITAGAGGVDFRGVGGTVINAGTISGRDGVESGVMLINQAGGTISGIYGVVNTGDLVNQSGAVIISTKYNAVIESEAAEATAGLTVVNAGTMEGLTRDNDRGGLVDFTGGGSFTNSATGVIDATVGTGLHLGNSTTLSANVLNAGTIITQEAATTVAGDMTQDWGIWQYTDSKFMTVTDTGTIISAANRAAYISDGLLILSPTAVSQGVFAGAGFISQPTLSVNTPTLATSTLELGSAASAGGVTLASYYRTKYGSMDFTNVSFATGSKWTVDAASSVSNGVDLNPVLRYVHHGASVTSTFGTTIENFDSGDTLDLGGITLGVSGDTAKLTSAANYNILTFYNGNTTNTTWDGTYALNIEIASSITNPEFVFTSDGHGGTDITVVALPVSTITQSGTVLTGITLTSASYNNPVTIGAGVTITQLATASLGDFALNAATAWTIQNDGKLDATGDGLKTGSGAAYGGSGILLSDGGSVVNAASGVIDVLNAAVEIEGAAGTVVNQGMISGHGIYLTAGGSVNNAAGATISGHTGISVKGTHDVVTNEGSINAGSNAQAIFVQDTGTYALVVNGASGSIYAGAAGNGIEMGGAGTVINQGTVVVNAGAAGVAAAIGIALSAGDVFNNSGFIYGDFAVQGFSTGAGDVVSNAAGATIEGVKYGITLETNNGSDTDTVVNAGYLGGGKDALKDTYGNLLFEVAQGSTINGAVVAYYYNRNSVNVLDLAASSGTAALGTSFQNFTTIETAADTQWLLEGNKAAVAAGQTFSGFAVGDTLDLTGVTFTAGETFSYATVSASLGHLAITNTAGSYTIDFSGLGGNANFVLSSDGNGGTDITVEAKCYRRGTLIRTARGEVPVEALAMGDLAVTAYGGVKPVKWIGRRSYDERFCAGSHLIPPVRFAANAIADGVPSRDLFVSPGHGMFVDGALVPAWRLINGVSITQDKAFGRVEYFHIELEEHDILLAENCPAESFYGEEHRGQFHNAEEFYALYPEAAPATQVMPRTEDGFVLDALKRRLAARAGILVPVPVLGALRGYIDQPGPSFVYGWAQDETDLERPVLLDILVDGRRVTRVLANRYRPDLREAGLGSGCHAFEFYLPEGVTGLVEVRRSQDGCALPLTAAFLERAAA